MQQQAGAAWSWSKSGETLRRRWRRVASTHDLSDLAEDRHLSSEATRATSRGGRLRLACAGVALMMMSATVLVAGLFSAVVSKTLPPFENPALRMVQEDWYYCLLVPMSVLATLIAVTLNWVSMKLFKHNS